MKEVLNELKNWRLLVALPFLLPIALFLTAIHFIGDMLVAVGDKMRGLYMPSDGLYERVVYWVWPPMNKGGDNEDV